MLFDGSSAPALMNLFNFILLFFGLYCFYAWYQLRDGTIPDRFALLNKDLDPKKCLDPEGYVSYLRPRLLVFAVLVTVFGVFSVLDAYFEISALLFPEHAVAVSLIVGSLLPFLGVVWFGFCLFKIQKELWA